MPVNRVFRNLSFAAAVILLSAAPGVTRAAARQAAVPGGATKQLGTIKAISGDTLTLVTDAGAEVTVQVPAGVRIVRVEPGQTSLKGATPIHLEDLQTGDRVLVSGRLSDDSKSITAAIVVAMKHTDLQAAHEQEREAWAKGVGGLVSAVDPASGTITISEAVPGGKRNIAVHTTSATNFRRYAPDSVKFDDARPSTLDAIKPGDQLRARGERNADGSEFTAQAIVSGAFRNIAGTVVSTDAAAGTLTVKDLATKKNVTVKITSDSDVRKLPEQVARFIAVRLRGAGPGGANGERGGQGRPAGQEGGGMENRGGGMPARGAMGRGGAPDFQQILSRMPHAQVSDLQKGDAVMIVSTQGSTSGEVTAITMLAGVEPILEAPGGGMQLSPWSLGGAPSTGDETGGGTPQQ
ncbi:MAG TPA: DUF5666 domain-containing protein [Candidatus Acidoferrales bacterium]|nr:DUF5666 domain-containing protein [Candidatus Acidoferrales bacterium]